MSVYLPHKDGFRKVKNSYIKSTNYSISHDYGVNAGETWMYGIGFILQNMVFLVMMEWPEKGLHQN